MASSQLVFQVRRSEPVLVGPAKPTRHEFKTLSDVDDQYFFRHHVACVHLFPNEPSMQGRDPVTVIREALAELLVYYYPLAGRLRELPEGKLVVECTGEGVLFVEADADVRLDQFGDEPQPPIPCVEELIHNVEGSDAIFHCPLLLIQVTRLTCGGFVFGLRFNHTMLDGEGVVQFMKAIGEMARGADAPTVPPVWERELLTARVPPRVTHVHPNFVMEAPAFPLDDDDLVLRSFFFGPSEVSALRKRLPPQLRTSTRFEVVTACIWRSRTVALGLDQDEPTSIIFSFNARNKCHPPLPAGYYGNGFTPVVAQCAAGELSSRPLAHALQVVRKAKASVTGGYIQSLVDSVAVNGKPELTMPPFAVSDLKYSGVDEVDFGWGRAVFAGPPLTAPTGCFQVSFRNSKGEEGILASLCLPAPVMERFAVEIDGITSKPSSSRTAPSPILSAL